MSFSFNENELSVFKSLFLDYCVLGGMPDVVKSYIETGTFSGTLDVQEQIRLDTISFQPEVHIWDVWKVELMYRSLRPGV